MTIKNANKIKSLTTARSNLYTKYNKCKEAHDQAGAEMKALRSEISEIEKEMYKKNLEYTVSEHALLRFCERVHNVDLEELSGQIMTEGLRNAISEMGDGKYPLPNNPGFRAVVRDKIIVTVEPS